jgi:hypothetical protein
MQARGDSRALDATVEAYRFHRCCRKILRIVARKNSSLRPKILR